MDILQYSALKEQNDVCTCLCNQLPALINNSSAQLAGVTQSSWWCWKERIGAFVCPAMWYCGIPSAPPNVNTAIGAANSLRVCNTAAAFNCGASCAWTVPAGASCMRIQLWGAGQGSGGGCCCGGAPFGSTGAYASIIMPAVPGCSYTLCSGCACHCFALAASAPSAGGQGGGASYAAGPGLCNFCAEGGVSGLYYWILSASGTCTNLGYKTASMSCQSSGACLCNSCRDYCHSSCATCGKLMTSYGYNTYYGTPCGISANSVIAGINGIYGSFCSDSNHYVCAVHPPIYGFDTVSQCGVYYSSVTCGGSSFSLTASNGYLAIPGAGGWLSHVMGGCNTFCSDIGKMGMVCVTWW